MTGQGSMHTDVVPWEINMKVFLDMVGIGLLQKNNISDAGSFKHNQKSARPFPFFSKKPH